MADEEYNFVDEPAPPANGEAPPVPAEANGSDDKEERRRRSRSRDRERRRRRGSRSRSRDRRRRSRSRDDRDSRRRRSRTHSRERVERERGERDRRPRRRSPTPPEVRAERARQTELDAMDRDARTVFAYNLPLKAMEKEIFQFFIRAGSLNDIKIITDKTTGRSKGFAYIEFARREDVITALALTGQPLMGQPVMVKMSEAEKNLAWEAAEQAKKQQRELEARHGPEVAAQMLAQAQAQQAQAQMLQQQAAAAAMAGPAAAMGGLAGLQAMMMAPGGGMPGMAAGGAAVASGPARLAVSNLPTFVTETDLRPIFEAFGEVEFVTLQRDAAARATGNAFVQYRLLANATKAKEDLAGLDLGGFQMVVNWCSVDTPVEALAVAPPPPAMPPLGAAPAAGMLPESLDEGAEGGTVGGGLKLTGQARAALMSRLAGSAGLDVSNVPQIPIPQMHAQPQMPSGLALEQGMLGPASPIPTQCLLLKNMFNPAEETEENWDVEIAGDVGQECAKYGPVEHVHVDKASHGFVYVKFGSVPAAANAQRALHGRWFAARQIVADFQFTPIYNQHFGI